VHHAGLRERCERRPCHRRVAERLAGRLVPHGFTFSGHPAACAAALACLRILGEDGLVARAATLGARLLDGLRRELDSCPIVGEVRGLGLMCAVELVEDRATRAPLRLGARGVDRLDSGLRARGVLAFADNPLILAPPLVITETDTAELVGPVAQTVADLAGHRPVTRRRTTG